MRFNGFSKKLYGFDIYYPIYDKTPNLKLNNLKFTFVLFYLLKSTFIIFVLIASIYLISVDYSI